MDNQPPKKSKKVWWILGGVTLLIIGAASSGGSNTQTPSASVLPSSQTANVAQQITQPANSSVAPITQSIAPPAPQSQPEQQSAVQPTAAQPAPQVQQTQLSNDNYYTNSDGNTVHSPAYSNNGVPAGATAQCADGTYSFSQHRSGTCSHHGGVMQWF